MMVKPFAYLLFFLSLFMAADAVAASVSAKEEGGNAAVLCACSEALAHDGGVPAVHFTWDCVAAEMPVTCGQTAWDSSKYLLRLLPVIYGNKAHAACRASRCGRVHAAVFGAASSDFFVVAYRKIVI